MGKSKNRSRSEVEFLRGEVRRLKSELKYYKRRSHIENQILDDELEDSEIVDIETTDCPHCGKGVLIEYDFVFATLRKCSDCGYEEKQRKRKTHNATLADE